MLNLKKNILVLNKMDLVGFREKKFEEARASIIAFLTKLGIAPAFIVPVSAATGDNFASRSVKMPWYAGPTLIEALDALENDRDLREKPLRMPVQDVYDRDGTRIVAGRIESGTLREGDAVRILPGEGRAAVAMVLEFGAERNAAEAGECVGLVLSGDAAPRRGDVLSSVDDLPHIGTAVTANIFWMSPQKFDIGETLTMRLGTQETPCRVGEIRKRIDSSTLDVIEENARTMEETEVGEVLIRADHPLAFELFSDIPELGRFVLERRNDIVAGGIITHG